MVPIGGDAPRVLICLWSFALVTSLLAILRLYTRLRVVNNYGMDDHFFNTALLFLIAYAALITKASTHGIGQDVATINNPKDVSQAVIISGIGQTLAIVGTMFSKTSLALFLIRILSRRRDKALILIPCGFLVTGGVASLLTFWLACRPVPYLWDRRIPGGACPVNPVPIALYEATWSIAVNFWYAIFPGYILWSLQMPKKEKILVIASLSLGLVAAIAGIRRVTEMGNLMSKNITKDVSKLIVWNGAELAVSQICIGIPVCRPLWRRWLGGFTSTLGGAHGTSFKISRGYKRSKMDIEEGTYTMHALSNGDEASKERESDTETETRRPPSICCQQVQKSMLVVIEAPSPVCKKGRSLENANEEPVASPGGRLSCMAPVRRVTSGIQVTTDIEISSSRRA